ncbi:dienelactone hydrolase family protein [Undibacterium sp. CY18W]|uniref:Dienelactone hydrolase family protein n=1 Tax=Undibacterium hunanense TaxID=2762292 RepID=A0ABR6ZNR6_9BURK|nr:dienelactone hydrolase family protein [Undibacterium hunanense]MBC3917502.1 dienelactone hydrolase family protein [Undibacterium hunanense]
MYTRFALLIGLLLASSMATALDEPEKVSFPSLDQQNGQTVQLDALWFRASSNVATTVTTATTATVIALHGCGGLYSTRKGHEQELNARHNNMARLLQENGYNVLMPDSFRPRGVNSICSSTYKSRDISTNNRRLDVQAALQWLGRQTTVDTKNIALLGWSNGGSTTLNALNTANKAAGKDDIYPRAAVAFYPGCQGYLKARPAYRLASPLLILIGAEDDWTPAAPCVSFEKMLAPSPVKVRVFADSYHDFDAPDLPLRKRMDVPNGVHPGQGVTTGSNPEAKELAYKEMLLFLKQQLNAK